MKFRLLIILIFVCLLMGVSTPAYSWTNGQNAVYVIGQPDFVSSATGTTSTTLRSPKDAAIDLTNGKLYIVDATNNRILRYSYPIIANQPAAELVFGQPDFASSTSGVTRNTLNGPRGVAVDNTGRLWVADLYNNRILYFNNAHAISVNQPDADGVLGQADYTSNGAANTQSGMNWPCDITTSNDGSLYVAEYNNNRVLRFDNAAAVGNGPNADQVLGQADFTSNATATTQNGMDHPRSVVLIGNGLFVTDRGNARVLRFDNAKLKANGANADGVLGQPDFVTNTTNITQNGMERPCRVESGSDGTLFVSDGWSIERVVVFNDAVNKADGADADYVLGQPDFTSWGPATTQNGFDMDSSGAGMAWDTVNGFLLVSDDHNNRVMVFYSPPPTSPPTPPPTSSTTATGDGGTGAGGGCVISTALDW